MIGLVLVVHTATVVLEPITYDEIVDVHGHVVTADLVEDFLSECYIGAFVFDNHAGGQMTVVNDRVAAA